METAVQRNSPVNVPSQISGILLNRIQTGEYQPGKSLPSVRSLTREFSVSPVTIMRSLDILEEAGVVLRNQGKGVFVSPEIQQNIHRRIAFCFPPEKFEPETVGAECWALASEFYRGLLAGAADEKAEVSFLQFPYECSETEKKQYLRQLSGFDVIIGTANHHPELFAESAQKRITLILDGNPEKDASMPSVITYDRGQTVSLAVEYAVKNGAKSAGAIAFSEDVLNGKDRAQKFLSGCADAGIKVSSGDYRMLEHHSGNWQSMLTSYISGKDKLPDIIYCDEQSMIPELYSSARRCGIEPGRDFKVIAICTGATLINLTPAPAYVRIPRFEMGYGIVKIVLSALKEKRNFTIPHFPGILVEK